MSLNIAALRQSHSSILVIGNHRPIIQSILDFDFLSGKETPSVVGIVVVGNRHQEYFWGEAEILLPCFATIEQSATKCKPDWLLNLSSGRRSYAMTVEFFAHFTKAMGGHLFAEDIPEVFALRLLDDY